MQRSIRALAVLTTLALAVAACGGGSGGDSGAADDTGGEGMSVTVTGTEFAFDPVNVTIAADTDVSVTFSNGGSIAIPGHFSAGMEGTLSVGG